MRKIIVCCWLAVLLIAIGTLFWYNEWKYQLPTPVPQGYTPVAPGASIALPAGLQHAGGKPLFLHFFNPDCPCSKFNIGQFQSLVAEYGNQVDFRVVAITQKHYSAKDIQQKFALTLPVVFNDSLATLCGVYSTPQVALLDAGNRLFYRGNYNKSRYCVDEKTSYAKMAISGLLNSQVNTQLFSQAALTSYGCSLPGCNR